MNVTKMLLAIANVLRPSSYTGLTKEWKNDTNTPIMDELSPCCTSFVIWLSIVISLAILVLSPRYYVFLTK